MKKNNFTILLVFILIVSFSLSACGLTNKGAKTDEIRTETSYSLTNKSTTLDGHIDECDLIVVGDMKGTYKEYNYGGVDFTEVLVKVEKVLKGTVQGKEIRVLQTGKALKKANKKSDMDEFNTLLGMGSGTKVLLFLKIGKSPFTDDRIARVPLGLHQGVYLVDSSGKLETSIKNREISKLYAGLVVDVINKGKDISTIESIIKEKIKN